MKTPCLAILLLSTGLSFGADRPGKPVPSPPRSLTNVSPRPFNTNRFALTNRFGTNDQAFTNRLRPRLSGPIAPIKTNFPSDPFPPSTFPPDHFPPDRFAPDRFPPDRFDGDRGKPPFAPSELEPPVHPGQPKRNGRRPAPPKTLTVIPSTPGAVPVKFTVRIRPASQPSTP